MMEARCPMDCHGQGYCMKDNTCQCMSGYFGKDCNTCKGCKKETDKFVTDFEVGKEKTPEEKEEERKKREEEEKKKREEEEKKKREEEEKKKREEEEKKKREEEEKKKREEEEKKKREEDEKKKREEEEKKKREEEEKKKREEEEKKKREEEEKKKREEEDKDEKKERAPKGREQLRLEEIVKSRIESYIKWEGYAEKKEMQVKSLMTELKNRFYKDDEAYWNEFQQEIKAHQDEHNRKKLQRLEAEAIKALNYRKGRVAAHERRLKRYQEYYEKYNNEDFKERMKRYIEREQEAIESFHEVIAFWENELKEIREELAKIN